MSPVSSIAPLRAASPGVQELLGFQDSEVKFRIASLMDILRDRRHEGWVLAAYPDPKTGQPLIGAGFSLNLPEREHLQRDPLNPHPFVEPSSAQLWQAVGLNPAQLQQILARYDQQRAEWSKKRLRRKIGRLEPEITDPQADQLLRIAIVQAVENARAYCRNFDQLSASQQMAMTQLVYQMGVNLEEFGQFLALINQDPQFASAQIGDQSDGDHWSAVQHSLMQSQWARLYRTRAVAVIAMLDPQYNDDPGMAEHRVATVLRPLAMRRRGRHTHAALRATSWNRRTARTTRRHAARGRSRRRV